VYVLSFRVLEVGGVILKSVLPTFIALKDAIIHMLSFVFGKAWFSNWLYQLLSKGRSVYIRVSGGGM
jgi:hypothetical protein